MSAASKPDLASALVTVCEDAFFAITAQGRLDDDLLRALAERRAPALRAALNPALIERPAAPPTMEAWEAWLCDLCAAIAPIAPPRWMPMAELIDLGLSLGGGARGVRSLFTSKPSEKEVLRVRTLGARAVRALGAVLASTGAWNESARLIRGTLIASLGLPEDDRAQLDAEAPGPAETLALDGFDPKLARALVRGGFFAAMGDGIDPREDHAIQIIARKLSVPPEDVNAARSEARAALDASRDVGEASVDAIRYVLADAPEAAERLAVAAARLLLPPSFRRDALTAINVGGPVLLGRKYQLDRKRRDAALGLAWVAAMHGNPSYTERAALAVRHARVAVDYGDEGGASSIRALLDRHVETELSAAFEPSLGN